jgi:UV radiation resistance-associated gene protein
MGTIRSCRSEALELDEDSAPRSLEISKKLTSRRASSNSKRPPLAASSTRARSGSQASGSFGKGGRVDSSNQTTAIPPLAPHENQQRSLEHVVSSRLVETFLALSLPYTDDLGFPSNKEKGAPSPANFRTIMVQATSPPTHKRSSSSVSTNSSSSVKRPALASRPPSLRDSQPLSSTTRANHSSVPSISKPIPRRAVAPPPPAAAESTQNVLPTPAPSPPAVQKVGLPEVPFFISPFHRPSTNPAFTALDPTHDFAPWANLSEHRLRVSLWGRTVGDNEWGISDGTGTGKGKEKDIVMPSSESGWSVICEWDVDLDDLVPLSSEVRDPPVSTLCETYTPF